jgi:hypothetical protein
MHLAKFKNGASFLKVGAPDIQKFSRSIVIPDDAEMKIEILSSEFTDYVDISIAPSKGNQSRLINPSELPYQFGLEYSQDAQTQKSIYFFDFLKDVRRNHEYLLLCTI